MSYSPASYTLLGISLTLATLSLIGTGGVKWWYLKEISKADKYDDDREDRISATCQSSAESGDDASAGLDLRLTQYYRDDDDRVVIDGDIDRNNADGLLQVLLSTDSSCSSPSNFIASIFSSGNGDNSEIEDWTIPRDQLEDLEDAIGDAIVVRDSGNDQIGCCIIRRRRSDFDD
ncbi:hypothetical protein FJT64_010574 [Amphibalanus amphitrite]|uniref:Uncharacterized protein n=1 Tax=Amphibalanus amphitrite TaxID=1232801 RepID=A0A6A4VIZ7_AMPAM|nr:uncharacterized protein LOC122373459 [Amphibalanus amphitrite]XP_043207478.1 uncharacterized protein LOC122373459 [Amphibalanus amphitrite]XP_043207479.1 uncharacterized protein LOC122373459 [Amphibalanus amphitrite]XP_043207480.1 uncharacterized protein LOC122373459 [Amphibalanus amphitrite]XP_043234933.1 uncharacterized protein LOC122388156 isoform X1 [Amphibalanus amphitrite]XP_043234934.1 uncharacterized protein LOC122388156 isoform X1 [Amphibalanus amphitrite]KAF0291280.1 hypothetical